MFSKYTHPNLWALPNVSVMEAVMEGTTPALDLLKDLPSRNSCHFSHYNQGSYKVNMISH